eukprot:GHVT01052259.1.p1 GENE.GHVT01052259.1~~GHVT01052259.1.p1  ORF type:complete len:143 (-),score=20.80 GHVT01052259.1:528-956(-)
MGLQKPPAATKRFKRQEAGTGRGSTRRQQKQSTGQTARMASNPEKPVTFAKLQEQLQTQQRPRLREEQCHMDEPQQHIMAYMIQLMTPRNGNKFESYIRPIHLNTGSRRLAGPFKKNRSWMEKQSDGPTAAVPASGSHQIKK